MDGSHYEEMKENIERLIADGKMGGRALYIFGHCNASEELADLLMGLGFSVSAFLDNNRQKQGDQYKGIPIITPEAILEKDMDRMLICIVSKFYEAMVHQLREMGYSGQLEKLADYNTYAEYSLTEETISQKRKRVFRGKRLLEEIQKTYENHFFVLCPFSALGDVYYAMAYLPGYLKKNRIKDYVIITVGKACADVASMYACEKIEILKQRDMDELIQAVLFTKACNVFIAHHDRPYANLLPKVLNVKMISFETLYRCGVFGLRKEYAPHYPEVFSSFSGKASILRGKAVILAPYAKSVATVESGIWEQIIVYYKQKGYQIYTNVVGEEKELEGTAPLKVSLMELRSVVERAGTFIGLRSGVCDVIRDADCKKIALFPDCYYSNTRWKVVDFFYLKGWKNIVIKNDLHVDWEEKNAERQDSFVHIGKDMDF